MKASRTAQYTRVASESYLLVIPYTINESQYKSRPNNINESFIESTPTNGGESKYKSRPHYTNEPL